MPRQQTLEASVAWSYDLLGDEERALFRRLSVFSRGFSLEATESICSDDLVDPYAVLQLLAQLVDKSLVQFDSERGRYRLLETLRHYGRERLFESGEGDRVRDRHLAYFLDLAEGAAPAIVTGEGPRRMSALEVDHDNLDAALEWAEASGAQEYMLRLVTALALFFELRGHLANGCQWFARALEPDGAPSVVRARALWGAAHVALYAHDFATFTRRAPEALAMAENVGDPWTAARALNARGYAELWFDPEQGRITLEHSVALGRDIDDAWAVADGLKMTSVALLTQTRLDEARTVLDALHDVARALDNGFFVAWYHTGVGTIAWFRGDVDQAREQFELALHHCRLVGDPSTGGIAASWLAEIEALTGHYDAADERLHGLLARRPDDDDFDPDEPTTIAVLPWLCTAAIQLQHSRSSNHSSIRRTCSRFRCGPRGRRLCAEQPSSPLMTKKAPRLRSPSRVGSLARRSTAPGSYHKPIINSPCWPVAPAGPMRPSASTMSRWPCNRSMATYLGSPSRSKRWRHSRSRAKAHWRPHACSERRERFSLDSASRAGPPTRRTTTAT